MNGWNGLCLDRDVCKNSLVEFALENYVVLQITVDHNTANAGIVSDP